MLAIAEESCRSLFSVSLVTAVKHLLNNKHLLFASLESFSDCKPRWKTLEWVLFNCKLMRQSTPNWMYWWFAMVNIETSVVRVLKCYKFPAKPLEVHLEPDAERKNGSAPATLSSLNCLKIFEGNNKDSGCIREIDVFEFLATKDWINLRNLRFPFSGDFGLFKTLNSCICRNSKHVHL